MATAARKTQGLVQSRGVSVSGGGKNHGFSRGVWWDFPDSRGGVTRNPITIGSKQGLHLVNGDLCNCVCVRAWCGG